MDRSEVRLFRAVKEFFNHRFNLNEDKEREQVTIAEISKGVEFKGTSLWVLIFAIFIASIGLNVNSTAVIIGAMLISPLMGPIVGIGLGAGINDFELIKRALKNLGIAVLMSVITSAVYFSITPLHEAQSELLARTTPTLWDVLIAFFGGLAGIVAGSRKEKSNTIPGVAIATALMPPLCTAGYGLANGNWYYFFGAFYLFFINSVFISVSTFLIVRFMKYPRVKFESEKAERKVKSYIFIFVVLTLIPSVYLAYNLVRRTVFEQNARNFISTEFSFQDTQVIGQKMALKDDKSVIEVTLYGKAVDQTTIANIRAKLPMYKLESSELKVMQANNDDLKVNTELEFQKMTETLRAGVLEDLYKKNEDALKSKDEHIKLLEEELLRVKPKYYPLADIKGELGIQYSELKDFSVGSMVNTASDTLDVALVSFSRTPARRDQEKIKKWLKLRLKSDSLVVVFKE